MQRLDGKEAMSWKCAEELQANFKVLSDMAREEPTDYKLHLCYLMYAFLVMLQDICCFRSEVFANAVFCGNDEARSNDVSLVKLAQTSFLLMCNKFKTSDSKGHIDITLPPILSMIVESSLERFPRRYLFSSLRDGSKKNLNMTVLCNDAWKLDDRVAPTFNNFRSAMTSRFFKLHPDLLSRFRFADNSGVKLSTMEANYNKPFM
jgi:hypothetical protein